MRSYTLALTSLLGALAFAWSGAAQAPDPFAALHSQDPLELARVVDRLGDRAVLERLDDETAFTARLSAIRAARFMRAPERALEPLAEIAKGRDPVLAPAAAIAVHRIARSLRADEIVARESDPEIVDRTLVHLDALASDPLARADLVRLAELSRDALRALRAGDDTGR
jgi:hypothetical protein